MLSLPIVYCIHKQVNFDLKNINRAVAVPEQNAASVANRTTNGETASTENVVIMTCIDAYTVSVDEIMWKLLSDYQEADLESMTLQQFCLMYKVSQYGQSKNKICKDTVKYIINFFPSPSSDQRNSERYAEYCKYTLMKHRPWAGCVDNVWGGSDATSSDIKNHGMISWQRLILLICQDLFLTLYKERMTYISMHLRQQVKTMITKIPSMRRFIFFR